MKKLNAYITIYFEITDSYMFGGLGSVGYTETILGVSVSTDNPNLFIENAYDTFSKLRESMADTCKVEARNVRIISKEEYEDNIEDEE